MELPSFLQFAAYLKKKKGSSKGSPTDSTASKEDGSKVSSHSSPTSSSSNSAAGDNAFTGTSAATVQNESFKSILSDQGNSTLLSTRIKDLEDMLAGKDTIIATLQEEITTFKDFSVDASTGMLSFGMEADYKTHIERYQERLEEFAEAVKDRDSLIVQLSEKLKASNEARATLETKEEQMAEDVALLQQQLQRTKEIVESHTWDTGIMPQDFLTLQNQLLTLEDSVARYKNVINQMAATLQERENALQAQKDELETKSAELSQQKSKSAKEIQELMREVEELNQRFVLVSNNEAHKLSALQAQLEEEFGLQLVQIKEEFRSQLDTKDKSLKEAENMILTQKQYLTNNEQNFKLEISTYKQQVEALNAERQATTFAMENLRSELVASTAELALQKEQNNEIGRKFQYLTEVNERSTYQLITLKQCQEDEIQSYNRQLDNLKLLVQQYECASEDNNDKVEIQNLKRQLFEFQESFNKQMSQSRQSHMKELESYRLRNEALELELDNISQNEEKCSAELNACKEAYIAQWGSSKHAQDEEIMMLRKQVGDLEARITGASNIADKSNILESSLESRKESIAREVASLEDDSGNRRHVKEGLIVQESATNEYFAHETEIIQGEVTLQEELNRYRRRALDIDKIEEKHSIAISSLKEEHQSLMSIKEQEISSVHEALSESKSALALMQEEWSRLSVLLKESTEAKETLSKRLEASTNKYNEEVFLYEEKLKAINLEVEKLTKGHIETLSSYHDAQILNNTLEEKVRSLQSEVTSCLEQLNLINVKSKEDLDAAQKEHENNFNDCKKHVENLQVHCEESSLTIQTFRTELAALRLQIHELNTHLKKELNLEVPETGTQVNVEDPSDIQLLRSIQLNFMTLHNLVKSREESFHSATSQLEESTVKLLSAQNTMVSQEELDITLSQKEEQLLEMSVLVTSLTDELKTSKQQLSERGNQIADLETKVMQMTKDSSSLQDCLKEMTVMTLAVEAVSAAKDELEAGYKNRIAELESTLHTVNEDSLVIRLESDQVSEKIVKAKDLLERMRVENNDLVALCTLHEEESSQLREKLLSSEARVQDLTSQVSSLNKHLGEQIHPDREVSTPVQSANLVTTQSSHETSQQKADLEILTLQIQQFEKYQEELVLRCNLYEEEVGHLREQLAASEHSLESLRQEVSNNKSSQSVNTHTLTSVTGEAGVLNVFDKRNIILSGGDSSQVNDYSILGRTFDFGYNSSGAILNSTEYLGIDEYKTDNALRLIENCSLLESARNELVESVQELQAKLQKQEMQAELVKEELQCSHLRCQNFETTIKELRENLEKAERTILSQGNLETKVSHLESEYAALQALQANLRAELVKKQVAYEEKIHKMVQDQFSESQAVETSTSLEELILELGVKAKEVIILTEKIRCKEETETTLIARVQTLEEAQHGCLAQLGLFKEETALVRRELEEAWQKQRHTEDELSLAKRELAISRLVKERLEKSQSRQNETSFSENLESTKIAVLKQALLQKTISDKPDVKESLQSPQSVGNDPTESTFDFLDNSLMSLQEKLGRIVQQNADLVAEGIDGIQDGSANLEGHQSSLIAELSAYREQHATLAEVLGSTGVLQEALRRQKQELMEKTQEQEDIQQLMESDQSKIQDLTLEMQALEHRMLQRDAVEQSMCRQKRILEQELCEIEGRLEERENNLLAQRAALEAEIRNRDLSIRHWQLQCRAQRVELGTEQTMHRLTSSSVMSPRNTEQASLDRVRHDLELAHARAVDKLKSHLVERFSASEARLMAQHSTDLHSLHEEYGKQLASLQQVLKAKVQELEGHRNGDVSSERHTVDLDELKNKLDENQKEIYTVLRHQFEAYAQQQVDAAVLRLKNEDELILTNLRAVHKQELLALRAEVEQQKQADLLNMGQAMAKQHSKELLETKESLAAMAAQYELSRNPCPTDSHAAVMLLKQLICIEFTSSFKNLTKTCHERYRKDMAELVSHLEEAVKHEDLNRRAEIPQLMDEQEKLLSQTEELLSKVVTEHQCMMEGLEIALDASHDKLRSHLQHTLEEAEATVTLVQLKDKVTQLAEEKQELVDQHREHVERLTTDHNAEVHRLQELVSVSAVECGPCIFFRQELEVKHTKEMEELRLYFEKKCSELEKHYSEEIFSQHSRKLSSSSSCDSELASDHFFTGVDTAHRVNALTHMCDSLSVEPSLKDLEEHYQRDYEKRIGEYRDQLDIVKHEIEDKYCSEMELLKAEYDGKVEELVRELAANHSLEIRQLETKHSEDVENLRETLSAEATKKETNARNEGEKIRRDLEASHLVNLDELEKTYQEKLAREIENLTDRMLHDEGEHISIIRAELEMKHKAELEQERKSIGDQIDQLTTVIKRGAEQEQETLMETQKVMMQELLLQHEQDLRRLSEQHELQLQKAQKEIDKLQDEHAEYSEHILQSKRRCFSEVQRDVLKSLEDQLQVLLAEDSDESACPAELLPLLHKVSARYQNELTSLRQEADALKEDLLRYRSMKDPVCELPVQAAKAMGDNLASTPKNRGSNVGMKQMASTLKCVISEIVNYMSVCEEELNNTLVDQFLKHDWENTSLNRSTSESNLSDPSLFRDAPDLSTSIEARVSFADLDEGELPATIGKTSTPHDLSTADESRSGRRGVRRVHFAPDISTIFDMDEDSLVEYVDNNKDLSTEFRTELDVCLGRLKAEAAALVGLSAGVPRQAAAMEEKLSSLTQQLACEVKAKEEYLTELDQVKEQFRVARERISSLESREDVTEGYGEQVSHRSMREGLAKLQDHAQSAGDSGESKASQLHLIEELIREGDRLMEEARHEKEDLKLQVSLETSPSIAHMACCQQIAAADKQLRSTRQFLEEQATEREVERDEFVQEIARLKEQLKATDKDRNDNHRRAKEEARPEPWPTDNVSIVENLEAQMREVAGSLEEVEARKEALESELKAAIEKVWVLRDIITELESQVEIKSRHEAELRKQVEDLEVVLEQQNNTNKELMQQLDSGNYELTEHITHLEQQLHLHRQQMEQLQPDASQVKQMKTQLCEFESTLDKKTKDLESLYVTTLSNTSCSTPSEDMSIRDQVDVMRCATPDDAPVTLPIDQLVRVHEKLHAHSRAEQAAVKKTRDLEMQVKALRHNEKELIVERDSLQTQVDDQLLKISSLKAHVDEQRTKGDQLVKQACANLEMRLHRSEMEISDLKETVENKDKQVAEARELLGQTRQAVAAQEVEWTSRVNREQAAVQNLQQENKKLKETQGDDNPEKNKSDALGQYIPVPVLIDTMMATKNAELERLSRQVQELQDQLEAYLRLDLTDEQRRQLNQVLKDVRATRADMQKKDARRDPTTEVLFERPESNRGAGGSRGGSKLFERRESNRGEDGMSSKLFERPESIRGEDANRGEDAISSGADSDTDENELRQLLLRKESLIISLRNQLAGQMTESLTDLRNEAETKGARILELEGQLAVLPALEEEIKSLRDQLKEAIEGVAQDQEAVRRQMDVFSTSQTKLEADLAEREAKVAEREASLLEKQRVEDELPGAGIIQQLESELEVERRSTKGLKDELNTLKAENDRLQSELDTLLLKSEDVDKLAGQVRKELDLSASLDKQMLDRFEDMATWDVDKMGCPPGLAQILIKILKHGMDALTFEELSHLHQLCCAATSAMIMQNASGRLPLEMVPTSLTPEDQRADKNTFRRRIVALEGEIAQRQVEANQNVGRLENRIRSEEKRLYDMRQVLLEEQRRNLDLHNQLGNQTRRESELEAEREVLKRQGTYQEERMQQFIGTLEREKGKVRCLEDLLQKERNNSRQFQTLLESERFRGRNNNVQDSGIIESMRLKMENALDNEAKMRIRLEKMEAHVRRLQPPSPCPGPCRPAPRPCDEQSLLDTEKERTSDLELALKREQLQVEQLHVQLERERQQALERLEVEREKREKLRRQVTILEEDKQSLNRQLDSALESLGSQRLLAESFERKLSAMQEIDVRKQRRRAEDDERNRILMEKQRVVQFDLEQKVLDLEQEVCNLKDQLSGGGDSAKLTELRRQLGDSLQREQQLVRDLMKQPQEPGLSAPLLQKLKVMNSLLEKHVEENANVVAAMSHISNERQQLQDRVFDLEAQLARQGRSRNLEDETEIVNGILEAERTTWVREKADLEYALQQAESRANRLAAEFTAKDEQTRHVLSKYLRMESYRKALIWQKRYLLVVLGGYQEAEAKTVDRLSRIARTNEEAVEHLDQAAGSTDLTPCLADILPGKKHRAVNKFKSCALVIVGVHRMHFMVRRWRHGRLQGSSAQFNRGSTESIPSSTRSSYLNGPRRKGSNSSCWSVPRSLSHSEIPGLTTRESHISHSVTHSMSSRDRYNRVSSSSPTTDHLLYNVSSSPGREHMLRRWQADRQHHQTRRSESNSDVPGIEVAEFINRFDQLQQTLNLNTPSRETKFSYIRHHDPNL